MLCSFIFYIFLPHLTCKYLPVSDKHEYNQIIGQEDVLVLLLCQMLLLQLFPELSEKSFPFLNVTEISSRHSEDTI